MSSFAHYSGIMLCLMALLEEDNYPHLTQQIFLYLPLIDLLECRHVNKLWNAHMQNLLKHGDDRWVQWSNIKLAHKMSVALTSVDGGAIIHKLHMNAFYKKLVKRNYMLDKCVPFKGLILLLFTKPHQVQSKRKKYFFAVSWHNIHDVLYVTKFTCSNGHYYISSRHYLILIWWYNPSSNDFVELHFILISDLTSFREKRYTTTIHSSDFVSPIVALNELISKNDSLRCAIKAQFPGLRVHVDNLTSTSLNMSTAKFIGHEIFYFTKLYNDAKELWVIDENTMNVVIKRRSCKSDWICCNNDAAEINLQGYMHPIAVFHIKPSNTFAVWDLGQPGHPRHVSFGTELPKEPIYVVRMHWSRSRWTIVIYTVEKTHCVYIALPPTNVLNNALLPCKCITSDIHNCLLEQQKIPMKAIVSFHVPKIYVYFAGERFTIYGSFKSTTETYISDSWKLQVKPDRRSMFKRWAIVIRNIAFWY